MKSNTLKYLLILFAFVLIAAVVGAVGIGIGFVAAQNNPVDAILAYAQDDGSVTIAAPAATEAIPAPDNFDVFWEAYDLLKEHFDGEVPEGPEVTYAAIDSLMQFAGACETDADAEPIQFTPPRTPRDAPANFAFFWQAANHLYADCDGSPTKTYMLENRNDPQVRRTFDLAFGKRPAEELYDLTRDPYELNNLAEDASLAAVKASLRAKLLAWMKQQGDEGIATEMKARQRQGRGEGRADSKRRPGVKTGKKREA